MSAMITDSGIETAVTSVERTDSRNSRITITAKASPSTPSLMRLLIDRFTYGAWS
jgi:hypothetical protein